MLSPRRRPFVPLALLACSCGGARPVEVATPVEPPPALSSVAVDASVPPPPADRVVRRSILLRGALAGTSVTTIHFDGARDTLVALPGLGSGYEVKTHLGVAADRTLVSFDAVGRDEESRPIDEHFFLEDGRATWKNESEQGTTALSRPAFYVPRAALASVARDAASFGLLTEALINGGGSLALLPGGQARAEVEAGPGETVTVRGPDGATKNLVAWSIKGLSLAPCTAWVDDANMFWGVVSGAEAVVPEGWEPAFDVLATAAHATEAARSEALARKLADRPGAGLAIIHARVLDVVAKAWLPDRTVVVVGDKIAAVAPSNDARAVPAGAETIDAKGKALLPGLWDIHARMGPEAGTIYLAAGVTSAASGDGSGGSAALAKAFDEGSAIGPHLVSAQTQEVAKPLAPGDDVGSPVQAIAFRLPPQVRRGVLAGGTESLGGLVFARTLARDGLARDAKAFEAAADAIARVTLGAAKAARMEKTTGSIAVGKTADLVLVDGDPLRDLGDLERVVKVVRAGVVYDAAPLWESLGIEPPH